MKLDMKRTIYIGFGFLTIMMLWQVYNWMVPLFLQSFLEDLLGGELVVGIVMALDNLFALFMIPVMSNLSDKTHTKLGRRMPYIIVGIVLSAVSFVFLPVTKGLGSIWLLIVNILLVLVFMNIYRAPCVALMPDITPKPLRSKGNSIINLMGGVGFAIGYLCIMFLSKNSEVAPFVVVSVIMLVCLAIMLWKVKENKFVADYKAQLSQLGISEEEDQKEDEEQGSKAKTNRRNVWLMLLVVFFVYMANNAVETFISLYSKNVYGDVSGLPFNMEPGSLAMVPFGVATFAFAVPAALLAQKIGRRITVMLGAGLLFVAYGGIGLVGYLVGFNLVLLVFFLIAGAGFALITINIYPMVVDNCSAAETGRYTGYYYTASMLAQSVTPAFSGLFISNLIFDSYDVLFPYCMVFIASAVVVLFLMNKDNKKEELLPAEEKLLKNE